MTHFLEETRCIHNDTPIIRDNPFYFNLYTIATSVITIVKGCKICNMLLFIFNNLKNLIRLFKYDSTHIKFKYII